MIWRQLLFKDFVPRTKNVRNDWCEKHSHEEKEGEEEEEEEEAERKGEGEGHMYDGCALDFIE